MWPFSENKSQKSPENEPEEIQALREAMSTLSPSYAYAPANTLVAGIVRIIDAIDSFGVPPVKGFVLLDTAKPKDEEIVAVGARFHTNRVFLEWSDGRVEHMNDVEQLRAIYSDLKLLWYEPPKMDEIHDEQPAIEVEEAVPEPELIESSPEAMHHLDKLLGEQNEIIAQQEENPHNGQDVLDTEISDEFPEEISDEIENGLTQVALPEELALN
jgi:hypothetical protein